MVFTRKITEKFNKLSNSGVEARQKRKEWRQELAQKGGSTPKRLKQTEAMPTADGEGTPTQATESGPSSSTLDLRPRSSPRPLSATPIRRHERVRSKTADKATHMDLTTADKATHMDLTTMDKATDVDLAYEDAATQTEQLDKQLKEQEQAIIFLRQQVRNRDALIDDLRRQLEHQVEKDPPTTSTRRKKNAATLEQTSRRNLAKKIADVIDRDRSRSVSRCSLQTLHREVRHKFGHYTPMKKEQLRQQQTIHEEDGLLLLSQLGTQKAYERMKALLRLIGGKFDVFPPLKKEICAALQYETISTPHGIGFFCSDIAGALEFRLSAAKDNLINFRPDELILKLSGDNGQGFTKITISLAHASHPNSPANNFIVAAFPANDKRENLSKFCGNIWQQIDQLNEIAGKKIKLFFGGDLSFLWAIIGHCGSAVTTFPSPVCDCRRDQLLGVEKCKIRTTEETVNQAEQFGRLVENGEKPTVAARALTKGIVDAPLLRSIEFDRIILAPFHVFQGIGNALIKELEGSTESAEIANGFFRSISARREAFRKKDMTGNSIRKVLIHADQLERLYSAEWPQTICKTMGHLAKIQTFTKAQPLSPRDLDELETSIDQFRTFLNDQPRMRTLLALKPKVHLLLNHFVPFARQHQFLALLDEQGDEALHSVWRRLEQLWKTMPDEEQMRQLLEHHFVSNWLLDTGKIDEMKRDREEQREEIGDRRETDEESDGEEQQFDFE
ncbi:hypothetical protein niasHS_016890 [Heterodera schachtii]|uniref:Uncharacterized protein n=1 Tax=Heterodera schachtii TaxID=97005 RepID=A0ABD2HYF5_HETSC